MEVKIGVRDVAREVVLESEETAEAVADLVAESMKSGSMLKLTDDKGRQILVPGSLIGYVEIGAPASRRIGFGNV